MVHIHHISLLIPTWNSLKNQIESRAPGRACLHPTTHRTQNTAKVKKYYFSPKPKSEGDCQGYHRSTRLRQRRRIITTRWATNASLHSTPLTLLLPQRQLIHWTHPCTTQSQNGANMLRYPAWPCLTFIASLEKKIKIRLLESAYNSRWVFRIWIPNILYTSISFFCESSKRVPSMSFFSFYYLLSPFNLFDKLVKFKHQSCCQYSFLFFKSRYWVQSFTALYASGTLKIHG